MAVTPSASYSLTIRVEIKSKPGMLGRVASAIGEAGGDIGAVDVTVSRRGPAERRLCRRNDAGGCSKGAVEAPFEEPEVPRR